MAGCGISRGCVGSVYSSSAVGEGGRVEYQEGFRFFSREIYKYINDTYVSTSHRFLKINVCIPGMITELSVVSKYIEYTMVMMVVNTFGQNGIN